MKILDKQLVNIICRLCINDLHNCKYSKNIIKNNNICCDFIPKYTCSSCKRSDSCSDNIICYDFSPKDFIIKIDKNHPIEKTILDFLYDLMMIEKSTEEAIIRFKQYLEANGIKALIKDNVLKGYINNLIALKGLDLLISSYGLQDFREKIISNEIDRIFSKDKKDRKIP